MIDLLGDEIVVDELLRDKFIEPPFSVLDTKTASWQQRKRVWISKGLKSDEGRQAVAIKIGVKSDDQEDSKSNYVSVFDPALCEVIYRWSFGPIGYGQVTGDTYTLTQDNVGKPISVAVIYTDRGGNLEMVFSQTTLDVTEPDYAQAQFWKDATKAPSELEKKDAVDLNDAIGILKMIVGLPVNSNNTPLSPYQVIAADFDQSGEVDLTDAIGVLKLVVDLAAPTPTWKHFDHAKLSANYKVTDPLSANYKAGSALRPGDWRGDAALADISAVPADVELVGVLSGDVDGSWTGV
jgi:hypothetical protein